MQELVNNSRVSMDVGTTERPNGMPNLPEDNSADLEEREVFWHLNKPNYTYAVRIMH